MGHTIPIVMNEVLRMKKLFFGIALGLALLSGIQHAMAGGGGGGVSTLKADYSSLAVKQVTRGSGGGGTGASGLKR